MILIATGKMILANFKDTYKKTTMLNPYRFGDVFVQNLSSLKYDGANPIGLIDEVNGNDVLFADSKCFNGLNVACLKTQYMPTNADLYDIDVTFYGKINDIGETLYIGCRNNYGFVASLIDVLGSDLLTPRFTIFGLPAFTFNDIALNGVGVWRKYNVKAKYVTDWTITFTVDDIYTSSNTNNTTSPPPGTSIGNLFLNTTLSSNTPVTQFDCSYFDLEVKFQGVRVLRLPLCEPMVSPSTHVYRDISGNSKYADVIGGTASTEEDQDEFHYLQNGLLDDGVNQVVPILEDNSAFADGTALSDPDAILQDGTKWLNDGSKLVQDTTEAILIAADTQEFWYTSGVPNKVTQSGLSGVVSSHPDIYGANIVGGEYIKNITLK